ncbi:hypothetical protein T07_5452 [Trichinella nelsoni]|uniref:Secreted protein n=1 Tax=Trichinella nelsoni TaxID=6336 RepID=A0A0V0S8D8_9BILA|nr:hypothetical protein T07_5452 [Trichinella nelsoni]
MHKFNQAERFHLRMLLILFNRSNVILSITTIGQCEVGSDLLADRLLDVLFCRLLTEMYFFLFHEQKEQRVISSDASENVHESTLNQESCCLEKNRDKYIIIH